jgi:two-component system, OmpR family, alkaline phosphatase synthesis response regulator PhoP
MAKRILVIEDEPHVMAVVQKRLETKGYEVVAAVDGREGLRQAHSAKPDLTILDLILPGKDDFQLCALFKRDDGLRQTPILMLSARTQECDVERGPALGANAYMTKPFKPADLLKQIAEPLNKPRE